MNDKDRIIQDLVLLTDNEITCQISRKSQLENRLGFLLALWGILLAPVTESVRLAFDKGNVSWLTKLTIIMLIISCVLSLCAMLVCAKKSYMERISFQDKTLEAIDEYENYSAYTTQKYKELKQSLERNEKTLRMKANILSIALLFTGIYLMSYFGLIAALNIN